MPSATLLGQSLLSGVLVGGLYALLGVGLSLSWRFLRTINLAHFGFIFLGAYLTYELVGVDKLSPPVALIIVVPGLFVLGVALQAIFVRFALDEFASVLVTFGIMVMVESLIQWIWTADFRKLESSFANASWSVGPIFVPITEAVMLLVAIALSFAIWAWLRFTYVGKALRAAAEAPDIAAAFGVHNRRLALLLAGVSAATAGVAGTFVAFISTLAPSQIYAWIGVVFAAVIMGGLGNPIGILGASLLIGVSEAITMALTAPSWAPLVSFTMLILILVLRPERV
jgi:branched-chain amino acid transport system permease protein